MKKINVLHIFPAHNKNALVNSFAGGMDKALFNVQVCYLGEKLWEDQDNRIFLGYPEKKQRSTSFGIINDIKRLVEANQIDILHCHHRKTTFYGAAVSCLVRLPAFFFTVHSLNRTRHLKTRLSNIFSMKPVTKIIAVSNAVQDDIARTNWIAKSKIKVIYNGIDTQKYQLSSISKVEAKKQVSPKNCDKLWVGTAGRMVPTKGHTYLLEAFSILRKQHKNIQLVLAGDGRLRPELVSMSKKLGIQEHVTFTGHFNNMPLFYKSLDMFLFPSIAEGMPLSVMEAMAAGVPVIASNVGGIPEIFGDEFSRYLVNPADTDSLLSGLDNLVSAGYLEREKLGDAKRKRIESNFTEKIMLDQLADTYMAFTGDTLSGRP